MRRRSDNTRNTIVMPKGCRERFVDLGHPAARRLAEAGVHLAGLSRLSAGFEMRLSQSPHASVIGTVGGIGWFAGPDCRSRLTRGTVLIVPAGASLVLGAQETWEIVWFHLLRPSRLESLSAAECVHTQSPLVAQLQMTMEGLCAEAGWLASKGIRSEHGGQPLPGRAAERHDSLNHRAGALYCELLEYYLEQLLHAGSSADEVWRGRLSRLWQTVRDRPDRPWRIADMCVRMQVSPATLQRLVQRYHGTTPRQMLIRIRMDRARDLLATTNYPVYVVAQQLGYADQFAFSTAFKRVTGSSPRQFRAAIA